MTVLTPPADLAGPLQVEAATRSHPFDLSGRTVLLATDGSPAALAATRVAFALATQHHALVHVVQVVDTSAAPIPPPLDMMIAMADATIGEDVRERQVSEVRALIASTIGRPCDWPIRVMLGTPAAAVLNEAKHIGASLIVLGLRRHGRLDRAMHDETVLNVAKSATCPVLGVSEGLGQLPMRALAALDFSAPSGEAARAAAALLGPNGLLVLAYVAPQTGYLPGDGESVIHELGVKAAFEQVAADVASSGTHVDHIVLHHGMPRSVADLLLEYADGADIDLIAAGSARHSRIDRWMLGSVSTDLLRDGRRSMLIVPPRGAAHADGVS